MTVPVEGIQAAWSRIQQIQSQVAPQAATTARAARSGDFATALATAQTPSATTAATTTPVGQTQAAYIPPTAPVASGTVGQRIADIASAELGVAEQPPGSNDAPRIAEYRTATAGSAVGPWCAYFTSWVARQAGVPVGENGGGIGYVPTMVGWAQSQDRWIPAQGGTPAVGDLVVFDRNSDGTTDHIGIVRAVGPDGSFTTIEGNSSNAVAPRTYPAGGAAGFVRLG